MLLQVIQLDSLHMPFAVQTVISGRGRLVTITFELLCPALLPKATVLVPEGVPYSHIPNNTTNTTNYHLPLIISSLYILYQVLNQSSEKPLFAPSLSLAFCMVRRIRPSFGLSFNPYFSMRP